MNKLKQIYENIGIARFIILCFLLSLVVAAAIFKLDLAELLSSSLVRTGMNGILVLAMLPAIVSGIGPNFGLPLGVICGLLGGLMAIELNFTGFLAILVACLCSIPVAVLVGGGYGWLLNKVKGSEMMVATYVGFSFVSLMNLGWVLLPFRSPEMKWPIGRGLRLTISLAYRYDRILNKLWAFTIPESIGGISMPRWIAGAVFPTGLILTFLFMCLLAWLFMRSKTGIAMKAVGDSRQFAVASGLNVDRYRMLGTVLSTVLGAIGIIVYSQSFGFIQVYEAPMFMGFPAVAAILIGGATVRKANISNVIIGTFLFQTLLVIALPVANKIITEGGVAEIARIIVSNGIILYALTQVGGKD